MAIRLPSFDPPADLELANGFWDGVEAGELRLPRCSECGRFEWYPSEAGPTCAGGHYQWVSLPGTGTVFSWTRVERSFLPAGGEAPYLVGLIELDGTDRVRLIANLAGDEPEPFVGQRVHVRFDRVENRAHPVFVPVDGASKEPAMRRSR